MLEKFIIGFEFEFGCNLTRRQISEKMKENGWLLKGNKPVKWTITDDASVVSNLRYDHEVISPPMPGMEALKTLKKFLSLMRSIGVDTNNTTGLHINVSFVDKTLTDSIDLLELISSVPDSKMAGYYDRKYNDTCMPVEYFFNTNHRISIKKIPESWEDKRKLILQHFIDKSTKYHTINLQKWKRRKYIEFRFAGGKGYEHCYRQLSRDIRTITSLMQKACNGKISKQADKVVRDYSMRFVELPKKTTHGDIGYFSFCDARDLYSGYRSDSSFSLDDILMSEDPFF